MKSGVGLSRHALSLHAPVSSRNGLRGCTVLPATRRGSGALGLPASASARVRIFSDELWYASDSCTHRDVDGVAHSPARANGEVLAIASSRASTTFFVSLMVIS